MRKYLLLAIFVGTASFTTHSVSQVVTAPETELTPVAPRASLRTDRKLVAPALAPIPAPVVAPMRVSSNTPSFDMTKLNINNASAEAQDKLAKQFASLIEDAIPKEYERTKDWGSKKRIQVGFDTKMNGLVPRIRKKEKEVPHGVWKKYRIQQVDPEKNLDVVVTNFRTIEPGKFGLSIWMQSKVHGWGQAKVYNRGVHVIALTAECDTTVQLSIDFEVSIKFLPSSLLFGVQVEPVVTNSHLNLKDFRMTRLGEMEGPVAKELGDGLRHVIEDELSNAVLTKKLNRAIDKKREKLKFTPDAFVKSDWAILSPKDTKK